MGGWRCMIWTESAIYREAPDIRTPPVRCGFGRKSGSSRPRVPIRPQAGSMAALELTCLPELLPYGSVRRESGGLILLKERQLQALAEPVLSC